MKALILHLQTIGSHTHDESFNVPWLDDESGAEVLGFFSDVLLDPLRGLGCVEMEENKGTVIDDVNVGGFRVIHDAISFLV